jgi:hypothetical protein
MLPPRSTAARFFLAPVLFAVIFMFSPSADAAPNFVGCPSDGMLGPISAPQRPPRLAETPEGLTLYASGGLQALAPSGWRCLGLYGSSGSTLIVTPETHEPRDFLDSETKIAGPVVLVHHISGDTSGRFQAANIDAQIFRAASDFVAKVKRDWPDSAADIRSGPYPTDRIKPLGPTLVEFETPPDRDGIGVAFPLQSSALPIQGAAILLPKQTMDVVLIAIRLPPELSGLSPEISRAFKQNRGDWPLKKGGRR